MADLKVMYVIVNNKAVIRVLPHLNHAIILADMHTKRIENEQCNNNQCIDCSFNVLTFCVMCECECLNTGCLIPTEILSLSLYGSKKMLPIRSGMLFP